MWQMTTCKSFQTVHKHLQQCHKNDKLKCRVLTGQKKTEKVRICVVRESQEKIRKKHYNWKVSKKSGIMILDHADWKKSQISICDFFAPPNLKKWANLWLPLNVQKLEVFQLRGGKGRRAKGSLTIDHLLFAYCSINTVLLPHAIVYHFWHLWVIVFIRSGKVSFHDWKVREFCYRRPIGSLTTKMLIRTARASQ